MTQKHLLTIGGLGADALAALLDDARAAKADPAAVYGALAGRSVLLHFTKASTRTRVSVETAVARLGGHAIFTRATSCSWAVASRSPTPPA